MAANARLARSAVLERNKETPWVLAAILAGSLLVATGSVRAEEDGVTIEPATDEEGGETVFDLTTPIEMGPISITATTNPISAFDYPGSVSVVDQEEIEEHIPSTPADFLRDLPNVTFTGGPRRIGQVPSIRGFTRQDVIVLLDGTRQNFISGHDGRFFVDPNLIEQAEVVRGANSALYGSGGLGGVIELRTKSASDFLGPEDTWGSSVNFGGQSATNELSTGLSLFGRPYEGVDLLGSFVYRNAGKLELGGDETLPSDDNIVSGFVKGSYATGAHFFEASWQRYTDTATEPNNGQDPDADDLVDKDIVQQTSRLAYAFNPDTPWIDLNAEVYYVNYKANEQRLDDSGEGPEGELLRRDLNTIGLRIDNDSLIDVLGEENLVLTYGVEYFRDRQDGASDTGERDGVPDAAQTNLGVFVQGEFRFDNPFGVVPGELLVIPGARFDYYSSSSNLGNDNSETHISPKLGLSYLPTDWLLFYGSYAEAFSAPNINDLYTTGVHFSIPIPGAPPIVNNFIPNPDLKPQTARTFEAGLGLQFADVALPDDYFEFKGGYFHTRADDLINLVVNQPAPFVDCNPFIPGNCNGTSTSENVARARLTGAEIEASYDNKFFNTEVSWSTINGKDLDTGEFVGSLQPDRVVWNTVGKIEQVDAFLGYRLTHASEFTKANDPSEFRDAYTTHDIYAIWAPGDTLFDGMLNGLQVAVGIDNLTDEAYSTVFTGANELGRNYKGLVIYTANFN